MKKRAKVKTNAAAARAVDRRKPVKKKSAGQKAAVSKTKQAPAKPTAASAKKAAGAAKRTKSTSAKRAAGASKTKIQAAALRKPAAGKSKPRPVARNAAAVTELDPIQFPEDRSKKKIKTHLNAKQLREFRQLLLQKRAELAGDVQRLTSEALHRNDNGSNDHSTMPIHMADLGSDAWEQDFTLGLIANEEALVRDIDEALRRIDDKTYGMCIATDQPISVARLYAKPWAKYCIEYARLREEGRVP